MKKQSNHIKIKTKKRKTIKITRIIPILIFLILVFGICSNVFNNKAEASTKDVYDIVLFWGQSNMVGSANPGAETRQGTSEDERRVFSEKTGIDLDEIVNNIVARNDVDVKVPEGCAYEYIFDPDTYLKDNSLKYQYQTWNEMKQENKNIGNNGLKWTDSHLKPVGYDYVYGETLKAVLNTDGYTIQGTYKATDPDYDTHSSACVNMVPQFCKTYYEKTGRKVIAVVCASSGYGIDQFTKVNKAGQVNDTYVVMTRKMWALNDYIDNRDDITIGKRMFVSMQGETLDIDQVPQDYINAYRNVIDDLKTDCQITNGALCETGGMIPNGERNNTAFVSFSDILAIHTAQETLVSDTYPDTVLGSSFGFDSTVPMTESEYLTQCKTAVSYIPGTSRLNVNNRWNYDQAIKHASLRADYDYGYKPISCDKTSELTRDSSMDMPSSWGFNGIHYTSASLCQIGLETATALANTLDDGQVTLSSSSVSNLKVGETASVNVTYNKSGGTITAEVKDPTVATVAVSGNTIQVIGKKEGTTTVTVTSAANGAYKKATASFNVIVSKLDNPTTVTAKTGLVYNGVTQEVVTVNNEQGTVYFSISTPLTASNYETSGTTTASYKYAKTYTVYWYTPGNSTYAEKSGTVTANIAKATPTITLNPTSGSVNVGETTTFTATVTSGAGALNDPTSSSSSIATASKSGNTITVTGVSAGSATITVSCDANTNYNSKTATYSVNVINSTKPTPVLKFMDGFNEVTSGEITMDQTVRISVNKPGSVNYEVTSSDTSKATISRSGNYITITPHAVGTVQITATTEEDDVYASTSATYTLTIKNGTMTVTADGWAGDYDGSAHKITVEAPSGTTVTYSSDGTNYSSTHPTCKEPGKYTIYYKVEKSGYTTVTGTKQVIILPQASSKATFSDKTWDTSGFKVKVNGSVSGFSLQYSVDKSTWTNITSGSYTNKYAADTTIYARFVDASNTNNANAQGNYASLKITKETGTLTLGATSGTLTYPTSATTTISGTGTLSVVSTSNSNVATASISGSTLTITPGTTAGSATITVRSGETDRYTSVDKKYTATVKNGTLTVNAEGYEGTYDGQAHTITVTCDGATITYGTDGTNYSTTKPTRTDVGTTTVYYKVEKSGSTTVTGSKTIKINQKNVSNVTITVSPESYTYDGSAKEPTVTVKDGSKTLVSGTDYTVSYSDNTNVGTGKVTITGKGNYTGTKDKTFVITEKSVSSLTITVSSTGLEYDGSAKTPTVTVKDGSTTLTKGTDYTVSYSDNTNAGTGKVTITGKGNYTGTKEATFTIGKKTLLVKAKDKTKEYGAAIPELTIEYSGNVNGQTPKITGGVKTEATATSAIGTYDILNDNLALADNGTFKAENYSLSYTKGTLTITGKDLSNYPVTVSPASYTYDGTAKEPAVTIKDGNKTLTNGTDYTVSYSNNTNVGTGIVKVIGKGNYSGTNTKGTFAIVASEATFTVTLEKTSYVYDGTEKEPAVTVKVGNTTLTKGTDYTVSYSNNKNVGTGAVTVTGKGNYGGSKLEHFTITKKDFVITAENKTRKYGEENPELTYRYSGNAEGEVPSFSGNLATSASKTSNVGEYDITNGTIAVVDTNTFKGSNYNLTYAKGKLTIGKAEGKINLTDGENEEPEEGEVVLNCKRVIGINATGAVSVTSSKENIATAEIKNNKIEITGIAIGEATITVTSAETNNYEAATRTYKVEVIPVALEKIEMKVLPKTSYIEEQNLEVTGGKIKLLFNNGVESEAAIEANMVTGYDKTRIGEQTLTVTYQGKETEYTVVVREKAASSIEMKNNPSKITYIQNYEQLDVTGGKIKVIYDNGTTEVLDITEEMVTGFDNTKLGTNTIKVTYQGKESTFNVQIVEKQAAKIEIIELPEVRTYVQDFGVLDVTGGKIKVTFDDETESEIDMTKEMITGFNNKNVGRQTLTLSFGGKTTTYEVEVIDKVITKVEIEELPEKTEYTLKYDKLDLTGAKLKITYNDSYTDIINVLPEMVSGFDNTKLGTNKIKVTYGGFDNIFNVRIEEHKVVRTEVVKMPDKVEYKQGEKLVLTGGKVKIYYNDETNEVVDMKVEMLKELPTFGTAGKKLVTLTIEGKDVSFEVNVVEEKEEEKTNNGGNNNSGNNQVDNTTAKTEIPQTGAEAWMIVLGVSIFVVFGELTTIKIFKNRDIK